jgi:hypothetical protein
MTPGRIELRIIHELADVLRDPSTLDPFTQACIARIREREGAAAFMAIVHRLMQGQQEYGQLSRFVGPGSQQPLDWEKEIDQEVIDAVLYRLIQRALADARGAGEAA